MRHITFKDNFEEDTRAGVPHPLIWGDMEKEDLEGLSPLNPNLEGFLAGAEGGDNHWQPLLPKPSHNNSFEWVKSCVNQLETLTWWWELSEVPIQVDIQEFARWVWASFQLPKVSSHAQGVANDYLAPPAPQSLDHDWFLPISNISFGRQDYHMKQPQKTLVYAKALQYWVEKAQPPLPDEPHQIVESVLALQRSVEPLTMFTNDEVLEDTLPSHWVKIMLSWTLEPTDPPASQEWSCSGSHRAWTRGVFTVMCSIGWSKPTATGWVASPSVSLALRMELQPEDTVSQRWTPPRFHRDHEIPAWE